jgi:hypothetical protein
MPHDWKVHHKTRNIHVVEIEGVRPSEFEHWVLLSSDRHHDSTHADWDLERKHLEEAVERNATVLDCGDLFDCMGGKYDPRNSKGDIRAEYALAPDYLDAIVRDAARFYAPYAKQFACIGRGNHETAITKRHEVDLTERLCGAMSQISGVPVMASGYGGWVVFRARVWGTTEVNLRLRWFHGSGGGGPMSHGVLTTRRMASWLPDADVVVSGHTHDHWHVKLMRERLVTTKGDYRIGLTEQHHVRTPSYKQEWNDGWGGWHVETGKPPKPQGAMWMKLTMADTKHDGMRLIATFTEAN